MLAAPMVGCCRCLVLGLVALRWLPRPNNEIPVEREHSEAAEAQ